jgi:hypothetical protein
MQKICIAIVSNRMVQPKTVLSLCNLLRETKLETHIVIATEGYTTAQGRIYCVKEAMKNECSHILFVDDDMVFSPDTLEKLLATGKEIVGVNSYSRVFPLQTTVTPLNAPQDELFECKSMGMGVALIDMEVFKKLDEPYFDFNMDKCGAMIDGEDAYFCKKARGVGYSIFVEPKVKVGHLGIHNFTDVI